MASAFANHRGERRNGRPRFFCIAISWFFGPLVCYKSGGQGIWSWSERPELLSSLPILPPGKSNKPRRFSTILELVRRCTEVHNIRVENMSHLESLQETDLQSTKHNNLVTKLEVLSCEPAHVFRYGTPSSTNPYPKCGLFHEPTRNAVQGLLHQIAEVRGKSYSDVVENLAP